MVSERSRRYVEDVARAAMDIRAPRAGDTREESTAAVQEETCGDRTKPREDEEAEEWQLPRGSEENARTLAAQTEMAEHDIGVVRVMFLYFVRVASSEGAKVNIGATAERASEVNLVLTVSCSDVSRELLRKVTKVFLLKAPKAAMSFARLLDSQKATFGKKEKGPESASHSLTGCSYESSSIFPFFLLYFDNPRSSFCAEKYLSGHRCPPFRSAIGQL